MGLPVGKLGHIRFRDSLADAFTPNTLQNFGKIITKHGHRVIELALKFYF